MYGPFEVHERLGIGGMATVHRAIERGIEGFQRTVALKRLLPHLAEDADFVRSFVREAKLASLLQHGNIVQIYELGRVGTSYFISMEYIRGNDLRQLLRQSSRVTGPVPVSITTHLIASLLDALDYAHSLCDETGEPLGVIHRDISPSNLLIGPAGQLKIIDFGIARATFGRLATHTGRIKGKLSYMAPEALSGHALDGRSDLWSVSVIAHELLTATPLFAARNDFETIEQVRHAEPRAPSRINSAVSQALDRFVLRGLAKDPSNRWSSAAEMREALTEIIAVDRLHCTSRHVVEWMDTAFAPTARPMEPRQGARVTTPERPAARQLPLRPRQTVPGWGIISPLDVDDTEPDGERVDPSLADDALVIEADEPDDEMVSDEIMEQVWGGAPAGDAIPIIISEVPDVSERLVVAMPIDDDDGPLEPRVTFRPSSHADAGARAGSDMMTVPRAAEVQPGPPTLPEGYIGERAKPALPDTWARGTSGMQPIDRSTLADGEGNRPIDWKPPRRRTARGTTVPPGGTSLEALATAVHDGRCEVLPVEETAEVAFPRPARSHAWLWAVLSAVLILAALATAVVVIE